MKFWFGWSVFFAGFGANAMIVAAHQGSVMGFALNGIYLILHAWFALDYSKHLRFTDEGGTDARDH